MNTRMIVQHRIFVPAIVGLAVCGYWILIGRPAKAEQRTLRDRIRAANQAITSSDHDAQNERLSQRESAIKRHLDELRKSIPPASTTSPLMTRVSHLAAGSGIHIDRMEPRDSDSKSVPQTTGLELTIRTSTSGFVGFLAALERAAPLIVVTDWSLQSGSETQLPGGQLTGTVRLESYADNTKKEDHGNSEDNSG